MTEQIENIKVGDRKCGQCGEILIGRSDKKFCGEKCRSAYHNIHNPKKIAFKSFSQNRGEIKNRIENIKAIVNFSIKKINEENLKEGKNSNKDFDLEQIKNYDILSQIRNLERLMHI